MKRAVLYLRVSTVEQTTANQERELRAVAERMGHEIVDHGISGAKGRDGRPQFDRMCRDAAKRQFDVIMAWSVDRLGRSMPDLVNFLSEIHALKVDLFLHQQGLDTTTPAGKAMFQMMGVFAEFERSIIQERIRAGLQRAKSEGKHCGRPRRRTGRPKTPSWPICGLRAGRRECARSRCVMASASAPCSGSAALSRTAKS
jgi:DNA invertase Pin-like site-specific DNA recombinase